MKSALFRKDNIGILVGKLSAPDVIKCDQEGKIEEFKLVGNVVETEYNDVLILGQKNEDGSVNVLQMESLPHEGETALEFYTDLGEKPARCMAFHKSAIKEVKTGVSKKGDPFKNLHVELNADEYLYFNIFKEYDPETITDTVVISFQNPMETRETKLYTNKGYNYKTVVNKYGGGYQVHS